MTVLTCPVCGAQVEVDLTSDDPGYGITRVRRGVFAWFCDSTGASVEVEV